HALSFLPYSVASGVLPIGRNLSYFSTFLVSGACFSVKNFAGFPNRANRPAGSASPDGLPREKGTDMHIFQTDDQTISAFGGEKHGEIRFEKPIGRAGSPRRAGANEIRSGAAARDSAGSGL